VLGPRHADEVRDGDVVGSPGSSGHCLRWRSPRDDLFSFSADAEVSTKIAWRERAARHDSGWPHGR
jgi:hypothetical protein